MLLYSIIGIGGCTQDVNTWYQGMSDRKMFVGWSYVDDVWIVDNDEGVSHGSLLSGTTLSTEQIFSRPEFEFGLEGLHLDVV